MTSRSKLLTAGAAVLVLAAAGGGLAIASGGDDDGPGDSERAITGSALGKASAAALKHTGGGRVTETEAGDEESPYEVEVTREGGGQVDVQLDRDFNVVGQKADSEDQGD